MTTAAFSDCPPFGEFFEALWGYPPFPWQSRLAELAAHGWPEAVTVPTGLGKTACVEIAIWTLAAQADRQPSDRTAATRLWWVVNRRALVDDTYEHALSISTKIERAGAGPLVQTAERLRCIAGDHEEGWPVIEVLRLRSGHSRNRPRNMAAPAIICSTVPMYGSRLLFRGHGAGRYTWSVDAALAGSDSLVILDEAHIAQPLASLLRDLASWSESDERAKKDQTLLAARPHTAVNAVLPEVRCTPRLVSVSATTDSEHHPFEIDDADRRHPIVGKRLTAAKPLSVVASRGPAAEMLAKQVVSSAGHFTRALVFANSPSTAREAARRLREAAQARRAAGMGDFEVILATGRMRGAEAEAAARRTRHRLGCASAATTHATVVVATQTLEVGADLDADFLVTEKCGASAIVQRLGRLNRLGRFARARAVLVDTRAKDDPTAGLYPEANEVVDALRAAAGKTGAVDCGPEAIRKVLTGVSVPADADEVPVLSEALLWEWVKTTSPPTGEAPVEAFYAGYRQLSMTAEVVWRAHIPEPGESLWPPLRADETVETSLRDARTLIEDHPELIRVLSDDARSIEIADAARVRPGSVLIVPTSIGCLDADGHWDRDSIGTVSDVSILSWGLPLTRATFEAVFGEVTALSKALLRAMEDDEADVSEIHAAAAAFSTSLLEAQTPTAYVAYVDRWNEMLSALAAEGARRSKEGKPVVAALDSPTPRLLLPRGPVSVTGADDGLSFLEGDGEVRYLDVHSADTARRARLAAAAIGVPDDLARIVEQAGSFHDLGKADERFQRWLNPRYASGDRLMAKSISPRWMRGQLRRRAGYPFGGRHEEHSRRIVAAWLGATRHGLSDEEADLLLHLVVAHHGRGRPLLAGVNDATASSFAKIYCETPDGTPVEVSASLDSTDWEHPARFARLNRRHGPWGLAALEALLRLADWESSQRLEPNEIDIR